MTESHYLNFFAEVDSILNLYFARNLKVPEINCLVSIMTDLLRGAPKTIVRGRRTCNV